MKNFNLN